MEQDGYIGQGMDEMPCVLTTQQLLAALEACFRKKERFPLEITGRSMRPLLRHGRDVVLLAPFCRESCKIGSILLYLRPNGRLVLHRVRKCVPGGYRMNGDAQTQCEFVRVEQVVAQADALLRGGRMLSCNAPELRVWDALWYPTRVFRPVLFGIGHGVKAIFRREQACRVGGAMENRFLTDRGK